MIEGLACIFFLFLYGCFVYAGYSGFKEDYKKKGKFGISGWLAILAFIALFVAPFLIIAVVGFEKIITAIIGGLFIGGFFLLLSKLGK